MNAKAFLVGSVFVGVASAGIAAGDQKPAACGLTIEQPWLRAAPPGAMMMAGYATVKNSCARAVLIVGVESVDFGDAMIHQTLVENGVSKMRHAESLVVPAKGGLRFAPGGNHLMLMQPRRPMPEGNQARIGLVLQDGNKVFAQYGVRRESPGS